VEIELRSLVTPLRRAEPEAVRRAAWVAHHLGRAFGERFAHCVTCLVGRGLPPRPNPWAYYTCVVEPALTGGPDVAEIEEWRESFASGEARRDPRVRAFCDGLSEHAGEVVAEIHRKRSILASFLEVRPDQLVLAVGTPAEPVIFQWRERSFLVTPAPASVAGAAVGALVGCPALGGSDATPVAIEETRFLGHRIVSWRWSASDSGPDGEA
jgi:hypothetical protein